MKKASLYLLMVIGIACLAGFRYEIILKIKALISIRNGVVYLSSKQLENGGFTTYACKDKEMTNCISDYSTFIDSIIADSLQYTVIENKKQHEIVENDLNYLLQNQEPNGTWNYWPAKSFKKNLIPSDVDDTANASLVLSTNKIQFIDKNDVLNKNKNEEGLFYTYIMDNHEGDKDIDCVVNINALHYLQNNDAKICSYINQSLRAGTNCSPYYYPDQLVVYYFLSKAYMGGVTCLGEEKSGIISSILEKQNKDGSFGNDLQNALAINALINIGYNGPEIKLGIDSLIKKQAHDGSWGNENFYIGMPYYPYNGSQELTTAVSVEALNKYLKYLSIK
jgi:hypothetical protein